MLFKSVGKAMGGILGATAKKGTRAAPVKRGVLAPKAPVNRKAGPGVFGGLAGAIGSLGMKRR